MTRRGRRAGFRVGPGAGLSGGNLQAGREVPPPLFRDSDGQLPGASASWTGPLAAPGRRATRVPLRYSVGKAVTSAVMAPRIRATEVRLGRWVIRFHRLAAQQFERPFVSKTRPGAGWTGNEDATAKEI